MDKRRVRKRIRQVVSLLMLLVIAFGGYKLYANKKFKDNVNKTYAGKINPDKLQESENVEAKNNIEINKNYLVASHSPKLKEKNITEEVSSIVNNYVEQFKEKVGKEEVKDVKDLPNIYTNYEVYKYGPSITSVKLDIVEENVKDQINDTIVQSYNNETGEKVKFDDIFIEELGGFLSKRALTDFSENNVEVLDDFKGQLQANEADFNKFILTDKSLDVYFKEELVDEEPHKISIPYEELEAYTKYDLKTFEFLSEEEIEEKRHIAQGKGGIRPGLDPDKPMVALTFDDGPFPPVTEPILDALEANGGAGTFFVLGHRIPGNESVLKRMADNGHEIGNHSFDHANLAKVSKDELRSQIDRTQNLVAEASGKEPRLLRPTYGAISDTLENNANMPLMLWSVDTLDWKHRDANRVVNEIVTKAKDGDIILMHDLYESTAEGVKKAIPILREKGFQLVTLSEMYELKGVDLEANKRYLYIE